MDIRLVSTENGFHDFDVSGAGTIRRVTVSENIKKGESFNIYFGDGHYVPHRKESAVWHGNKGVAGYLIGDLEKSIRKSDVFIGESVDSDRFYRKVTEKHCSCLCSDPVTNSDKERRVLAVDLDHPDYGRESSRYIIFKTSCKKCEKSLTFGAGVGSFHSTGIDNLKHLAAKEAREPIDWNNVITNIGAI